MVRWLASQFGCCYCLSRLFKAKMNHRWVKSNWAGQFRGNWYSGLFLYHYVMRVCVCHIKHCTWPEWVPANELAKAWIIGRFFSLSLSLSVATIRQSWIIISTMELNATYKKVNIYSFFQPFQRLSSSTTHSDSSWSQENYSFHTTLNHFAQQTILSCERLRRERER